MLDSTQISLIGRIVSECQTDWNTSFLQLSPAYNVQVQKSMKVFLFSLGFSKARSKPTTVVTERVNLDLDDTMTFPMYPALEKMKRATNCRHEADKNLCYLVEIKIATALLGSLLSFRLANTSFGKRRLSSLRL